MALQTRPQSQIPRFEIRMQRQVQDDSALFLHYDSQAQDLRTWFWYVTYLRYFMLVDGIYVFVF
jgi:hypothetical protein